MDESVESYRGGRELPATDHPGGGGEVVERRRRLRALDVALGDEIEDAGALTFEELQAQVNGRELLGRPVSVETLWEWWHYALRRNLIECLGGPEDGLVGLSDAGRTLLGKRRASESIVVMPTVSRVVRAASQERPITLAIAVVALLSSNPTALSWIALLILMMMLVLALAPLSDLLVGRRLDQSTGTWALARHVAWLEGDAVPGKFLWNADRPATDPGSILRLPHPTLLSSEVRTERSGAADRAAPDGS